MSKSNKPTAILFFNRFYLAATLVGIFIILVHYGALRDLAISKGASPAGPFLGIPVLVFSYMVLWFFIYRRSSNVAK